MEAMAILEAVHKWGHFLAKQHFDLITDQRSEAFGNAQRLRKTRFKSGEWNSQPSITLYITALEKRMWFLMPSLEPSAVPLSQHHLHSVISMMASHPGVARLLHFVRSMNLPFSTEDVQKVCAPVRFVQNLNQGSIDHQKENSSRQHNQWRD